MPICAPPRAAAPRGICSRTWTPKTRCRRWGAPRAAGTGAPRGGDDADLRPARRGGAEGYLLKDMDPEDLVPALEAALRGDNVVAKEMVGTLARIVQGQTNEQIGRASAPLSELTPRETEI